jgi:DNA-binding NtrC family response regulator
MKGKILIVDDNADYRQVLKMHLEDDFQVSEADSSASLQKAFNQDQPDVVLLDVQLPDANGLTDLLPVLKKRWPDTEVIILTGKPSDHEAVSWAVDATKRGAFNFVRKGDHFDREKLLADVSNAMEKRQQAQETNVLRRALETMSGASSPVFQSSAMREVVRTIERIAPSDVAVLITGESGTGKELVARAIHNLGSRANRPFVAVSCGAIPETLMESELFGNEKGAYTGSMGTREGFLEKSGEGTLFLDEIGELSLSTQVKLLRVLQEREFSRLGSSRIIPLRARLIFATHRNLFDMVAERKFREDFYYRINVMRLDCPALAEHPEDISQLAYQFLGRYSQQYGKSVENIQPDALNDPFQTPPLIPEPEQLTLALPCLGQAPLR